VLKNKKDCADVYCITLTELQAHRDALIQNNYHGHCRDNDGIVSARREDIAIVSYCVRDPICNVGTAVSQSNLIAAVSHVASSVRSP